MRNPDLHLYYIKNFIQSQILIKIKIECNIKHNKMLYNIFSKVVKMAVTSAVKIPSSLILLLTARWCSKEILRLLSGRSQVQVLPVCFGMQ